MSERCGRMAGESHLFPIRIYFEDTDAAGIVYYARYLHFIERARTEMMRCLGIPHAEMTADHGVMFAVRKCEIDFLSPARLDDALEVRTRIVEIRGASLEAEQLVRRGEEQLVRALVRLACITPAGRPARIPKVIGQTFQRFSGQQLSGTGG